MGDSATAAAAVMVDGADVVGISLVPNSTAAAAVVDGAEVVRIALVPPNPTAVIIGDVSRGVEIVGISPAADSDVGIIIALTPSYAAAAIVIDDVRRRAGIGIIMISIVAEIVGISPAADSIGISLAGRSPPALVNRSPPAVMVDGCGRPGGGVIRPLLGRTTTTHAALHALLMLRHPLLLGAQGIRMVPWTTARSGGDCETAATCRTVADMAGHH